MEERKQGSTNKMQGKKSGKRGFGAKIKRSNERKRKDQKGKVKLHIRILHNLKNK